MQLSPEDRARVGAAVSVAEEQSNGEIVTIATDVSDKYHDVGLHWAIVALLAVLAGAAAWPPALEGLVKLINGGWAETGPREQLTVLMVAAVLAFVVVFLLLK